MPPPPFRCNVSSATCPTQNPDGLKTTASFACDCRRQQRARLHGEADPWLLLEKTLLQHGLQEEPRIHDVDVAPRIPFDAEFADNLTVLPGPVIQDQARDAERVLPLRLLEGEVTELDLEVALIGDRGVRRNEWTVSPGGPWHEQQCRNKGRQREGGSSGCHHGSRCERTVPGSPRRFRRRRRRARRSPPARPAGRPPAPQARRHGAYAGQRQGCGPSSRRGSPRPSRSDRGPPPETRRLRRSSRPRRSARAQDRTPPRQPPSPSVSGRSPDTYRD